MNSTLTVFYDHSCPLCRDEMHYLAARCAPESIQLIDASAYDFENDTGVSTHELMTRIHARRSDGTIIVGMEVFREVYGRAGFGWLLAPTGWPILRSMFDRLYLLIATHRYRIPAWIGRRLFRRNACQDGRCAL